MACYAFQGIIPVVHPTSFVHPLASIVGDIIVGPGCYIAAGASLRGDLGRIVIEGDSSIQDNATIHVSSDRDTVVRRGATISHGAVIHGCEIGEHALVGINAVVLDNAVIGAESFVAAQAMVSHDTKAPPRSLLMGIPARLVRALDACEVTWRNDGGSAYQELTRQALETFRQVEPLSDLDAYRPQNTNRAPSIRITRTDMDRS